MAEELRNNMQKMDEDDLFSVSGGVSVHNRQRPNVGTYTHVDQTVLSGVTAKQNPAGTRQWTALPAAFPLCTSSSTAAGENVRSADLSGTNSDGLRRREWQEWIN